MKQILSILLAGLLLPASLSAKVCKVGESVKVGTFEVKGKLSDAGSKLYISQLPFSSLRNELIDSVAVNPDGTFEYTVTLEAPTQINVYKPFDTSDENAYVEGFSLVAIPGEKAVLNGTINDYDLSGSNFYVQYNEVSQFMRQQNNAITSGYNEVTKLSEAVNEAKDESAKAAAEAKLKDAQTALQAKYADIQNKSRQWTLDYIKQHPNSEVSAAIIGFVDSDSLDIALNSLSSSIVNGRMAPAIEAAKAARDKEKTMVEAEKNIKAGAQAPDFSLKTPNGSTLALKDLRGKYVLLDFWGTWCGWCIKGIPDMKEAYEKQKDKVEFLSIDCNDPQEKWLDALKKYQMPWKHVKNEDADGVPTKYNIQAFPTKILINPDGTIDFIFEGEGADFYNKLDEALK